jgi:hypothetical protein
VQHYTDLSRRSGRSSRLPVFPQGALKFVRFQRLGE